MLRLTSAVAVLAWLLWSSWSAELAVEPDAHPEAALQACVQSDEVDVAEGPGIAAAAVVVISGLLALWQWCRYRRARHGREVRSAVTEIRATSREELSDGGWASDRFIEVGDTVRELEDLVPRLDDRKLRGAIEESGSIRARAFACAPPPSFDPGSADMRKRIKFQMNELDGSLVQAAVVLDRPNHLERFLVREP